MEGQRNTVDFFSKTVRFDQASTSNSNNTGRWQEFNFLNCPCTEGSAVNEVMVSGSETEAIPFARHSNDHFGDGIPSSSDSHRQSCKRRTTEPGDRGQLSLDGSLINVQCIGNRVPHTVPAQSNSQATSSVIGHAESSQRNCRLRVNPLNQQYSNLSVGNTTWYSSASSAQPALPSVQHNLVLDVGLPVSPTPQDNLALGVGLPTSPTSHDNLSLNVGLPASPTPQDNLALNVGPPASSVTQDDLALDVGLQVYPAPGENLTLDVGLPAPPSPQYVLDIGLPDSSAHPTTNVIDVGLPVSSTSRHGEVLDIGLPTLPSPQNHHVLPFSNAIFATTPNVIRHGLHRNGSPILSVGTSEGTINIPTTIVSHPTYVPVQEMRNVAQQPSNLVLANTNIRIPGNPRPTFQVGSSSVVHASFTPTLVPHYTLQVQNQQRSVVRRPVHATVSAFIGQGSPFPLVRSGLSSSLQQVGQQGFHRPIARPAAVGIPSRVPALSGNAEERQRLLSEIRNALASLRRGDDVNIEDLNSIIQRAIRPEPSESDDESDTNDDMRLEIDDMSYEELLELEERMGHVSTGLEDELILKHLKQKKYVSNRREGPSEVAPCCICQDDFVVGVDLGVLDCGHIFHTGCIRRWLNEKNSCPICKAKALDIEERD